MRNSMLAFSLLLFFCYACTIANEANIVTNEKEFRESAGKNISIKGVLHREKGGEFLICDDFRIEVRGFHFSDEQFGKKITLYGMAKILKPRVSREEWEKRIKTGRPFQHAGYRDEWLVLQALNKEEYEEN